MAQTPADVADDAPGDGEPEPELADHVFGDSRVCGDRIEDDGDDDVVYPWRMAAGQTLPERSRSHARTKLPAVDRAGRLGACSPRSVIK